MHQRSSRGQVRSPIVAVLAPGFPLASRALAPHLECSCDTESSEKSDCSSPFGSHRSPQASPQPPTRSIGQPTVARSRRGGRVCSITMDPICVRLRCLASDFPHPPMLRSLLEADDPVGSASRGAQPSPSSPAWRRCPWRVFLGVWGLPRIGPSGSSRHSCHGSQRWYCCGRSGCPYGGAPRFPPQSCSFGGTP